MIRRLAVTVGAAALLAFATTTPSFAQQSKPAAQAGAKDDDTFKLLNLFGDVMERVRNDYVDPVSDQTLIESALNGMLTSLDPHSGYLNAEAFRDMQAQTSGQFGGLGIEVTMENGWIKVISPIDDTPASAAGLKPNDFITSIDGESVQGMSLNDAVDKMRGPISSPIKLSIRRENAAPFDVTLQRAVIKIQTVKSSLQSNVGYIRVSQFVESTDTNLKAAIADLKKQSGGKIEGYVLDLRNNPGGLLDQAVAVGSDFIAQGEIVSTRSKRPEDTQRFDARGADLTEGLPLVVLINDGSASASEIVAGALQDHRRAILMGTRSFGKGSVQTIIPLPNRGAMRLTTARYYTPSGRSIQAVGIEPDITVPVARVQVVSQAGDEIRSESSLPGALKNEHGQSTGTVGQQTGQTPATQTPAAQPPAAPKPAPGPQAGATPQQPPIVFGKPDSDYQLARAIDLLHGLALYRTAKASN